MAQTKRDTKLDSRSNRLKLPARKEPYWSKIAEGEFLGYYRPQSKATGSWVAKWRDSETGARKKNTLCAADDYAEANGETILDWKGASAAARGWFEECREGAIQADDGTSARQGPYTVACAIADYLEAAGRRGMKALGRTESAANAHILPDLGSLEVAKLTRKRLEAWLAKVAESPRRVRTPKPLPPGMVAPKPRTFKVPRPSKAAPAPVAAPYTEDEKRARRDTANRILTVLKAALNYALDRKLGGTKNGEAWQTVKPFRATTSARVRFLNPEESQRLVNACPPDFRRLVIGALHSGARYGELGRLQARDFNPEAGTLYIAPGKTGKARQVPLTEEAQEFFASVTAGLAPSALMFDRTVNRRTRTDLKDPGGWAESDQHRFMKAACLEAKVGRMTFHELRHTYASMMINKGVPPAFVAELIGDSVQMVIKHYGHLAPSAVADSVRALAPRLGLGIAPKVAALKISGGA